MFKTDLMNRRSAIRYLETKYDLLEEEHNDLSEQYNRLVSKIDRQEFDRELEKYGLKLLYAINSFYNQYRIDDEEGNVLFTTSDGIETAKQRFEGYKKGFEQPIDILVEVEDDEECDCYEKNKYKEAKKQLAKEKKSSKKSK